MDSILHGIPHVICYLDDILTGKTDQEHLHNLENVLQRLQEHGITVCKEKCELFREAVEYLGHRIDARGIHTTTEKVKAIVEAPELLCQVHPQSRVQTTPIALTTQSRLEMALVRSL